MDRERTAGGTKTTNAVGGVVGRKARGKFAQAEARWFLDEVLGERAGALTDQISDGCRGNHETPPGILGCATARKKRERSANSLRSRVMRITGAIHGEVIFCA